MCCFLPQPVLGSLFRRSVLGSLFQRSVLGFLFRRSVLVLLFQRDFHSHLIHSLLLLLLPVQSKCWLHLYHEIVAECSVTVSLEENFLPLNQNFLPLDQNSLSWTDGVPLVLHVRDGDGHATRIVLETIHDGDHSDSDHNRQLYQKYQKRISIHFFIHSQIKFKFLDLGKIVFLI